MAFRVILLLTTSYWAFSTADRQQRRAQGLLRQSAEHLAQALRLSEESAQFVSVYVEVRLGTAPDSFLCH